MIKIDANPIIQLAEAAGEAIMKIYHDKALAEQVEHKADDSPVTLADKAAHDILMKGLQTLHPDIPVISEEGDDQIGYETRKDYKRFFLVDPLDGTREFIGRNGNFTVNIALLEDNIPIAGFIFVPVRKVHYVGIGGEAYKLERGEKTLLKVNYKKSVYVAVRSKSHASPEEEEVLSTYDVIDSVSIGSSLKFCLVAEGTADIYYRHGPTMEWDIAAGHAIVANAGGRVLKGTGPEPFQYNKESLLNGSFLCLGW